MKSKLAVIVLLIAAVMGWFMFCGKPQQAPDQKKDLVKSEEKHSEDLPLQDLSTQKTVVSEETSSESKSEISNDPDTQKIVAEFSSGEKINLKELKDVFSSLPNQLHEGGLSKIYTALLNRLVDTKILLKAAREAGVDKNPEVLKRITEAQEALIQKAYLDREIAKLINDSILQDKYQELLKLLPQGQTEIKISHILVKTKEEAESVLKQIKTGKDFNELVKEKSLDTESKSKDGDLGYVRKEDLPKDFSDAAFKAAKGSIVPELMKVGEVGYSVVRVDDKRPVEPPKFEKVKDDIYKAVSPEYAIKVIEKLRQESGVKKIGLDGKPLVEKTPEQKKAEAEAQAKGEKTDQPNVYPNSLNDTMVVAEFNNGEKITLGDLKESMVSLPAQLREVPFDKVFEALLNRAIDMRIISAESRAAGFDKDPKVLKKIADAKDALLQKFFLEQEVAKVITPEMVNGKYQQFLKMIPKNEMEARIRHILVKTKEEAINLIKSLKEGASFDEMVKAHSLDEQSKQNNGDLGYVRRNEIPKEFSDVVFKAPKATLLPDPIQVGEMGYSVVRVEDKRPIEPPKLEEARPELMKVLSAEQSVIVLQKLREQVTVKKFDMDGQPLIEKKTEGKLSDKPSPALEEKTNEPDKVKSSSAEKQGKVAAPAA